MSFDKKRFDLEMDEVREREIDFLAEYLSRYIKLNAHMREHSIDSKPNDELIREIAKELTK